MLEIARFSLHLPSGSGSSAFTILCKCEMGGKRPAAQWDNGCYSSVGGEWRGCLSPLFWWDAGQAKGVSHHTGAIGDFRALVSLLLVVAVYWWHLI